MNYLVSRHHIQDHIVLHSSTTEVTSKTFFLEVSDDKLQLACDWFIIKRKMGEFRKHCHHTYSIWPNKLKDAKE